MYTFRLPAALLLGAFLIGGCAGDAPSDPATPADENAAWLERQHPDRKPLPDHYIVLLADNLDEASARNLADELAWSAQTRVEQRYRHVRNGFAATMTAKAAERLRRDPRVLRVMPDYRCFVAPKREKKRGRTKDPVEVLPTPPPPVSTQEIPWGIAYVGGPIDATGTTCWIVDTGIELGNADLNVDVERSRSFVPDGRGAGDLNGHGTHIAGTIAAKDNLFGVVGVAANATCVSVRVLDQTANGSYSWLLSGLDYIAEHGKPGDVVNLSLAGPPAELIDDAVRRLGDLGLKVVVAAGNEASFAGDLTPCRVQHPNVYTVSAIDESGCLAWFSNWGNPPVRFAAPGVGVLSLALGGGTVTHSGTSVAAPHVAGLLLGGSVRSYAVACKDNDGVPDPIAHR